MVNHGFNKKFFAVLTILLVAVFFRFYQLGSIPPLETRFNTTADTRMVSAFVGVLAVLGLYFLTKRIFDWRTASIASFFLAVSFWHVNFSRINLGATLLTFILVWGSYFLWKALRHHSKWNFFVAGIIGGLGFYSHSSYILAPAIFLLASLNFWFYLKRDFSHAKYEFSKSQFFRGLIIMTFTAFIVALPIRLYLLDNPENFLPQREVSTTTFSQEQFLKKLGTNIISTLGMFHFSGDYDPEHNISGPPILSIPIGILFLLGFLIEFRHWLKRKHGHLSVLHTFLFAWFFIMLLPGFLATETTSSLLIFGAAPVVMIFSARGFMWGIDKINDTYRLRSSTFQTNKVLYRHEIRLVMFFIITIFLISITLHEYSRYFNV